MNLIPTIREALGLQENEEFNLINPNEVPFPEHFRFTSNSLQIHYPQGWEEANGMTLRALLRGDLKVVKLPWKPKESGTYNYVNFYNGEIVQTIYVENCISDKTRVESGNCYRTYEEAKEHVDEWMEKLYGKEWRKLYEPDTSN